MTKLSELPKLVGKRSKRRGRGLGSGSGAKSGRGTTRHQTARTSMPLHFEGGQNPISKKYPLLRGKGRNRSVQVKPCVVNVERLNLFKKDTVIDVPTLIQAKIVSNDALSRGVKILGRGKLEVALKIMLPVSEKADKKIKQAGGTLMTS